MGGSSGCTSTIRSLVSSSSSKGIGAGIDRGTGLAGIGVIFGSSVGSVSEGAIAKLLLGFALGSESIARVSSISFAFLALSGLPWV